MLQTFIGLGYRYFLFFLHFERHKQFCLVRFVKKRRLKVRLAFVHFSRSPELDVYFVLSI